MGSTSYIIPLRSESDEENERSESLPQPATIAFRNKITPTSPTQTQTEKGPVRSRSPLFRAKSDREDRSAETEMAAVTVVDGLMAENDSDAAKTKRSAFSNKSNSAGTSNSCNNSGSGTAPVQPPPLKPNRSHSGAKSSKKRKCSTEPARL